MLYQVDDPCPEEAAGLIMLLATHQPNRSAMTAPVRSWELSGGRPLPGPFGAVWHLPHGPLPYIEGRLDPGSVVFK